MFGRMVGSRRQALPGLCGHDGDDGHRHRRCAPRGAARLAGPTGLWREHHRRRRLERRQHVRQGGPLRDRVHRQLGGRDDERLQRLGQRRPRRTHTRRAAPCPITNMFTGEVIWGGVGSGLYGMFFYIVIAVFIAGLMVGRTPEYLGKKIEAREIKLAAVGALLVPTMVLVLTAIAIVHRPRAGVHLQPRRARLLRDALRLRLAGEQQRQRVRRLRRDGVLDARRLDRALARALRAADRRTRARRLAGGEEDRAPVRGHVPHRRPDVRRAPRRRRDPDRRSDDLPRPHARADRGGALT